MTDIRELLELAARAMGRCPHTETRLERWEDGNDAGTDHICVACGQDVSGSRWDPRDDSGDSHDMCAALEIDTEWVLGGVRCFLGVHGLAEELFVEHNDDRAAAWRMAALRMAAEIGRAKG